MESTSLVAIPGSRIPEMLGNFHLDNHHVEEWSDPQEPGSKHLARKEVGKWVNVEKNADIHYQKQDDSKQTDRGHERSRTEVIQGSAPDSSFQVLRSHHQYKEGDETSGSTMQQSSSTSYHVSSSRSVRSTTKTTSNKTTTKTVTVSGGGGSRTDDFENLRMSFTPLDTSTQRERINVSRSGTMGIRRPPTRRHTPAALLCSSPDDGPDDPHRPEDGQIIVDSDDNLRDTPDPPEHRKLEEQQSSSGISIVGFKNISPKIRVGFPVEIQLELQTKLRSSSTTLERDQHHHQENSTDSTPLENTIKYRQENNNNKKETEKIMSISSSEKRPEDTVIKAIPLHGLSDLSLPNKRNQNESFDFRERRKSFLSESYDNDSSIPIKDMGPRRSSIHLFSLNRDELSANNNHNNQTHFNNKSQRHSTINLLSHHGISNHDNRPTGSAWDLIQNVQQARNNNESSSKNKHHHSVTTLSSGASSSGEEYIEGHHHHKFRDLDGPILSSNKNKLSIFDETRKIDSFSQRLRSITSNSNAQKTIVTLNASEESLEYDGDGKNNSSSYEEGNSDSLDVDDDYNRERDKDSFESTNDFQYHHAHPIVLKGHLDDNNSNHLISTPDVLHHDNNSSLNSLSPSLERSRKLLKMLDETPDLLNKMSFKSYFSTAAASEATSIKKQEDKDWEDGEEVGKDDMDWEAQRQLSFLNDSLSRILDDSRNSLECIATGKANEKGGHMEGNNTSIWRNMKASIEPEVDFNGNFKEVVKTSKVSQTWISGSDGKPSQTVRDNDVVTSISATNDVFKSKAKRVEFCKTEVHFTPDSGRFNIVETDENKPSTAHLFRRKKRSERNKGTQHQQSLAAPISLHTSSSSMSSLDSNSEKNDAAYILEMQVSTMEGLKKTSGKSNTTEVNSIYSSTNQSESRSSVNVELLEDSELGGTNLNSLPMLTSLPKSDSDKSDASGIERSHGLFLDETSEQYEGNIQSPSHTILSNYGEMKIQRYLKQLKSNSRENSSSPTPSTQDDIENDQQQQSDEHFRFDNILYENGSFVPLATRRSLIEMNNRNRKRLNAAASQSSDNSSTTSLYSLPTSDKDQYGTLRLGAIEATVVTETPQPHITAVEFRYMKDDSRIGTITQQKDDQDLEYHNLSVKERRERFSSVPSPVLPNYSVSSGRDSRNYNILRQSATMSPTGSQVGDSIQRPSSTPYLSKKPPTPILPLQLSTFEKTGGDLRETLYRKHSSTNVNATSNNDYVCFNSDNESMNKSDDSYRHHSRSLRSTNKKEGKLASKSIVTICSNNYNDITESDAKNSQEMLVMASTIHRKSTDEIVNEPLSPEPVLSLDHTWKGPAHFDNQQDSLGRKGSGTPRSLTYASSPRLEPEWVSKAKSRENRVTDWSLIEKQQQAISSSKNTEPPWISEIRFRNKPPSGNDEIKSNLPKVSVVYPWQRESSASKESSAERERGETIISEESHIVSIVPEPNVNINSKNKDKRFGSYDLYSGKSLPPIKSLKSVPEVSVPTRKSRSIVEVHSEPEHYIHNSPKHFTHNQYHRLSGKKDSSETRRILQNSLSKSEKKSSSMKIISEGMPSYDDGSCTRDAETFPKKSRKPLQLSQLNTDGGVSSRQSLRLEERHQNKSSQQPKPPKPPQRVTSLSSKEEHHPGNNNAAIMAIPPYRESSRHHHKEKYAGTSSASASSHTVASSSSKRHSSRSRKSATVNSEESSGAHGDNSGTPVHHRHPTVHITKLPMRTAKVSMVDGKRVGSSSGGGGGAGTSSSSKSKLKHHAASPLTQGKGETTNKPVKSISGGKVLETPEKSHQPTSKKRDLKGKDSKPTSNETKMVGKGTSASTGSCTMRKSKPSANTSTTTTSKTLKAGYSAPLKTSTRPPSLEVETKKRKTTTPSSSAAKRT